MLPVHRVIGHKNYGNTPPGGWKGRKGDPVYDMDWRRNRVANFHPRSGDDMPTAQEVADAVVARLLQANNRTVGDTLLNIEQAVSDDQWSSVSTAVWNRPIAPGATLEDPVRAWQMLLSLDATLRGLTALVAQQNGLTIDDVRRVVSEEVAKGVQVDVAVTGGDPTAT